MKKPTVTVAVSAYNEERNIKAFLRSILAQKEDGFKLKKILIVSDGSSDNTVKYARELKSSKIVVKEFKDRIGKSSCLNQIYKSINTDILVQSDADVIFAHEFVVRDLIQPLIRNKKVGMCGGNPMPLKGKTFIEKAINCTSVAYSEFRKKVRGGNNVFSADGRLLGYKKELVKKIKIPGDMIANDMYTYFCCLYLGYQYRYVESAVVYFRSPQTLKDHIRQNTRFRAAPIRMKKYFPKKLVEQEIVIPRNVFVLSLIKQFIRHPVLSLSIYIINKYCKLKATLIERRLTARWDMADTTKSLN